MTRESFRCVALVMAPAKSNQSFCDCRGLLSQAGGAVEVVLNLCDRMLMKTLIKR